MNCCKCSEPKEKCKCNNSWGLNGLIIIVLYILLAIIFSAWIF